MEFGYLFTNVLAALATCFGWFSPVFALWAYYAFSILRPQFLWFWSFSGNTARYSYWVALSCLVGWVMQGFGDWANMRKVRLAVWGMAIYLACGVFTTYTQAIDQERAVEFLLPQLKIGVMMMVTLTLIRTPELIKGFAWVVCATLGYLAWVFNSQYYFDGWNRVWPLGFGGIDNNGFAMVMVMAVPLSFFMGINAKQLWIKGLCFLAAALEVHVILFSFSRGGQLGLIMVGCVLFIFALVRLPNKLTTIALTVVMVMITLHLAGEGVRERFMSIFVDKQELDTSAASRYDTWAAAWASMKDHPLGLGPRNFNLIADQYGLERGKSVHNLFLQTGADYGVLGMIGLAMFYLGTAWYTFRIGRTRTARRQQWPVYVSTMVTVSLSVFLVCSTFIGMESVEVGFIICQIGLCTCLYVADLGEASAFSESMLPELVEVPEDQRLSELVPA